MGIQSQFLAIAEKSILYTKISVSGEIFVLKLNLKQTTGPFTFVVLIMSQILTSV